MKKSTSVVFHLFRFPPCCRSERRSVFIAVLCLLAFPVISHLAWADPADREFPVRIAGVDYLGDMPTLVADKNNIFRQHGIEVEVVYGNSGRENLDHLRSGEIDFAMMALTPIVIDALADSSPGGPDDPVILASVVHSTELNHVVTLAGHGIETPGDLVNRRIALPRGTNAELVWWLFAMYHDLDPGSVELVDLSPPEILEMLLHGEVDAGVLWEPWTTRLRQRIDDDLYELPGSNIYTAKWVIVTTRRMCLDHAARCQAILAAYNDAIEYIERNPDTAVQEYIRFAAIDPGALALEKQLPDFYLGLNWSLISTLQQQFTWAAFTGYSDPDYEPDILSLIEASPLRTIAPNAVSIPGL